MQKTRKTTSACLLHTTVKQCQRLGLEISDLQPSQIIKTNLAPMQSINTGEPFERVGMDVIGFCHALLVAIDIF